MILNEVMSVLAKFMLASVRIGAFLVVSPIFGSTAIPVQVRVVAASFLAVTVMAQMLSMSGESVGKFGEKRVLQRPGEPDLEPKLENLKTPWPTIPYTDKCGCRRAREE